MTFTRKQMVAESNRIEGIERDPTEAELEEFDRFMQLRTVRISDLERFVNVYAPGNRLRERVGQDVRVGSYHPPRGGPDIVPALDQLLTDIYDNKTTAWEAHLRYESLHPFTDGNGRSGRMLWYWMMQFNRLYPLGFLHAFYYQTLSSCPRA